MKRGQARACGFLRWSAACAALIAWSPAVAHAIAPQEPPSAGRTLGLGVVIGEPTGLSGEKWLSPKTALDVSTAWSTGSDDSFVLAVDHVWYDFSLDSPSRRVALHYGLGGRVLFEDHGDDHAGIRLPVGLTYFADRGRVGIFMQVAPILDLAPATDTDLQAGLGVRYFLP